MVEPKTPWLYPYREDPQQTRLGQPVFRPFMPVSLAANDASTPELEGLIDTGADAILASGLLADELGLDLSDNEGEELHAVGGRTVTARYKTVSLRLHHHDDSGARSDWEAPVGFVDGWHSFGLILLGNIGSTTSPLPRAALRKRSPSRIAAASMSASASSWPRSRRWRRWALGLLHLAAQLAHLPQVQLHHRGQVRVLKAVRDAGQSLRDSGSRTGELAFMSSW